MVKLLKDKGRVLISGNELGNTGRCWGRSDSSTNTSQQQQNRQKAQKAEEQRVCAESHPGHVFWGLVEHKPTDYAKMVGISFHSNHKTIITRWGSSCGRRTHRWERGVDGLTSAAELAPHIPTGSCNRKTWCLSDRSSTGAGHEDWGSHWWGASTLLQLLFHSLSFNQHFYQS